MAEILDVNELLCNVYEPLRQFRFILSIDGIDAFTVKSASRPQLTFGETVIDYINQKRYIAGKGTWAPITVELYDPIVPSAAQKVYNWIRLTWENTVGRMGYASMYYKDITLKLLDPVGAVAQQWDLQGTWISDCNAGPLDYATDDPVTLVLTLRFNQAVLSY